MPRSAFSIPGLNKRLLVFDEPHIGGRLLHHLEGDAGALQLRDGQARLMATTGDAVSAASASYSWTTAAQFGVIAGRFEPV